LGRRRQVGLDQTLARTHGARERPRRRLAELIQETRTLLILDGLESLQYPPGPQEGQLKDQTLAELLRLLVWQNPGLIVITTRVLVDDIRDMRATTAPVIELGHLSAQAGAQLLQSLEVHGEQEELEAVSREFGGHSLALNLLGTYLRDILDGDIRRRGEVNLLEEDAEHGGHARRIMRSYERQLAHSPALAALYLIGLFDRPAKRKLIQALRRPPVIEGLNDQLVGQGDHKWKRTLTRLRRAKLIAETSPDEVDAHPLVREYFGERLKAVHPEAWCAGHGRLYEHLLDTAKPLPDTLAEMSPLLQAMHHGCKAERHPEVLREIYALRVARIDDQHYQLKVLGAYGSDLVAITGLFEEPWRRPISILRGFEQAFLLNQASSDLRALGRLSEAVGPLQASLDRSLAEQRWRPAARSASNLSMLLLTLGDVAASIASAEESIAYADRSEGIFERISSRALAADALHQAGDRNRAEALFKEAEAVQVKEWPDRPWLHSIQGYAYCDLLLALGRPGEVRERAAHAIEIAREAKWLLEIAVDHLSLARVAEALGEHREASAELDHAIDSLRRAGHIEFVVRGLLARAALFRDASKFGPARSDLDEAMRIARRSEMRLFQCDAHLEYARLALAEGDEEKARGHVAEARRLVDETGYGRRRPEVEALESEVR
jgi:tetratricopeptide (TPR) repeat protein